MKRLWGLRVRLIVLLVILTLVPIILFTVIFQLRMVSFMKNTLWARMQTGLEKSDRLLSQELEQYTVLLYAFCTDPDILQLAERSAEGIGGEDRAVWQERFRQMCERTDGLLGISVRMPDGGWVYYDAVYDTAEESPWLEDGPYGRAELLSGEVSRQGAGNADIDLRKMVPRVGDLTKEETYYGPMAVWRDGGTKEDPLYYFSAGMAFSVRTEEGREDDALICLCVDERRLQETMEGIGDAFFYLEKDGVILSAPDASRIGRTVAQDGEPLRQSGGVLDYGEFHVEPYGDCATCAIGNTASGWTMIELYPLADYRAELRQQRLLFALMAGIVVLSGAGFILFVTRPLLVSVNGILNGMKQVENGDYSVRLKKHRGMSLEMERITDGFNAMVGQTEQLIARVRQAAKEQRSAEISALEAQIDPHFLYNTLDVINWKAVAREEYEISEMVGDLADILRYAIKDAGGITTLGREIAWLKKYVRLQQEKLGSRVQIFGEVSREAAGAGMHKMLLQPLVENSIRHGLSGKEGQPILVITGEIRDGLLRVTVGDNGAGMEPELVRTLNDRNYHRRNHFGIENVRKRLTLYYGETAGLSFESEKGQYTRVTLTLPVMEGEGKH